MELSGSQQFRISLRAVQRLGDRGVAIEGEWEGAEQPAAVNQHPGHVAQGCGQVVEMLEQLVADHQIAAGIREGEGAEVLMDRPSAELAAVVLQVFAGDRVGNQIEDLHPHHGDSLGDVEAQVVVAGQLTRLHQPPQQQVDRPLAREDAIERQGFAVVIPPQLQLGRRDP